MQRGMIWPAQDCPPKLGLDQACLNVFSKVDYPVQLYGQVEECHVAACDELLWKEIPAGSNVSLVMNSAEELLIRYTDRSQFFRCGTSYRFSEHQSYLLNITDDDCSQIYPKPTIDWNYWLPAILFPVILILIFVLWMGVRQVYRAFRTSSYQFTKDSNIQSETTFRDPSTVTLASTGRQGFRLFSLDAFRGICIAMMIFVNYGGGEYKIFNHAAWDGLTFADVVFPWFLWLMGASLVLSLRSQFRNGRSRISVWLQVFRRSVILIVLGLILNSVNGHNSLLTYRIPGVLQRIGLAYFIIASVEACFVSTEGPHQSRICEDISYGRVQNLVAFLLAAAWLVATFLIEVPDNCGAGYLGPGGLDRRGKHQNCTGGAAGYIDRLIFTPVHIYQHPTCENVFRSTQPYDPEGLLGTLTAAIVVHLGAQAGRILICFDSSKGRVFRWIFWGLFWCICAGLLCDFQLGNEAHIPINKNLFSLSYVLLTGGLAYIVFSLLYVVIDAGKIWDGAPFTFAGMNAILLYVGHELVRGMFPWSWEPLWNTHVELLAMNLWGTSLWLLTAYFMCQKNMFLSI